MASAVDDADTSHEGRWARRAVRSTSANRRISASPNDDHGQRYAAARPLLKDSRLTLSLRATLPLLLALHLAACDALPRDPQGTSDRIAASKMIRVGLTQLSAPDRAKADALIAALATRSGAAPLISQVITEPGFAALDEGRLDLVIGSFGEDSPWATDVAFGPPLAKRGSKDHPLEVKAAMRNGENRWIMTVEQASRQAAPGVADR